MLTLGDLNNALDWNETPAGVKDSHTGEDSKLPIMIPRKLKKEKKKKKKSDYIRVKKS